MFHLPLANPADPHSLHAAILETLRSITEGERDLIANMANTASVLYHTLPDVNWVGFYCFDGTELVLGPFHGKPACIRIAMGRGVCGTAAATRTTQLVEDVELFPGHIACDAASRSELVMPMVNNDRIIGVLDLDSPRVGRFTAEDARAMESVVALLLERSFSVVA